MVAEMDERRWTVGVCPSCGRHVLEDAHVAGGCQNVEGVDVEVVPASRLAEVERERDKLFELMEDAIDLALEGWAYASDYFREKWQFAERTDVLCAGVGALLEAGHASRWPGLVELLRACRRGTMGDPL